MANQVILTISIAEEDRDWFYGLAYDWPFQVFHEEGEYLITSLPESEFSEQLAHDFDVVMNENGWEYKMHKEEDQNWNQVWESNFDPVEVDQFVRIIAPFHEEKTGFIHQIVMEPRMAFGTGHHETTYMMLKLMQEIDFNGKNVWDYGCGTAVLGIVAAKEGAQLVVANDIEIPAVQSSIENAERNDTSLQVYTGGIDVIPAEYKYDVIIANITKNVLLDSAKDVVKRLNPKGIVLLSGILIADIDEVSLHYQSQGLSFEKSVMKGNWAALKFCSL